LVAAELEAAGRIFFACEAALKEKGPSPSRAEIAWMKQVFGWIALIDAHKAAGWTPTIVQRRAWLCPRILGSPANSVLSLR
jgi:hypothetical protein